MPTQCNRRHFVKTVAVGLAANAFLDHGPRSAAAEARRQMTLSLAPGSIGVRADQRQTIALAHKHGFEAVEAFPNYLASLDNTQLQELLADLKTKGLVFGAAGLPVEFRQDDTRFADSLRALPKLADALQRAGVDRVTTWISPAHGSLTYLKNFAQHARRLREAARVLKDRGQRLGLEYVGTPMSRQGRRFHFIHTLVEMQELIADIGTGNVGLVLDSWHWWTAGETTADLLKLKAADVVSVDLNDAPAGLAVEQQQDGKRELPCATGVIPVADFLNTLNQIGFDGPVRAEPFNKALNDLPDDDACAAVIRALRKAMALLK